MATIADELLNDFEDDGDEEQEQQAEDFFGGHNDAELPAIGATVPTEAKQSNGGMELDGDEEEPDEEYDASNAPSHIKMDEQEDEAETKARIEKMQLGSVSDVRSVAGLMRQLQPVIEVSSPDALQTMSATMIYISCTQP
jgi:U4/U6 small nuclear ribonucleoprotein PRP31